MSEIRIATLAFFWFPFSQNIFLHPFNVHSVSLYLLGSTFNPFTFKVISDTCVPIGIFLIFLGLFCRPFHSLVFTDYVSPFSICCKAGLMMLNSLNFCLSVKLLISLSILNEIFAGYTNLGCRFFSFSTLKYIFKVCTLKYIFK